MPVVMSADAVVEVLAALEKASVRVWLDGGPFPPAAFAGQGRVGARQVRCLSAEAQVQCHGQGYEPTENDLHDMERLQERFGVVLPLSLCRQQGARRGG